MMQNITKIFKYIQLQLMRANKHPFKVMALRSNINLNGQVLISSVVIGEHWTEQGFCLKGYFN